MISKKECVAMLLAGGQGSRLSVLTHEVAKPAVPYGGKYRIIDFPLSNCINSGIDTVGVLTQYKPLELNEYIGGGEPWDLDRLHGGVHVLPPYQRSKGGDWYKGTANAIHQNINFIERYSPEYVLILSGDHIYKMDYAKMIERHKQTGAACTIAVFEVPLEEASRFGIMKENEEGQIIEFYEKPEHPPSNLASMGIYVFSWQRLREYLKLDEKNKSSSNDFGNDVIPSMLKAGEKMVSYHFEGYWRDVGTIDSLWESNLDLLNPRIPLDLADKNWRIYSRNSALPPHYISEDAFIQNSLIAEGCNVYGRVDFSVLFVGAEVEEGAVICDSIIMPGAIIKRGAVVQYAIIAENAIVEENARVGARPEEYEDRENWGVAVVGSNITIGKGETILPSEIVENNRKGENE